MYSHRATSVHTHTRLNLPCVAASAYWPGHVPPHGGALYPETVAGSPRSSFSSLPESHQFVGQEPGYSGNRGIGVKSTSANRV